MNAPSALHLTEEDRSLDALFAPRSVAVIGASSDQRRFGGRPIQYLIEAGFEGPIYPVNPARAEIQGLKAYPSILDVDGPVDCALLAVGADVTQQTRSEEHTSELQSLMRISYAVFCLKKKKTH